MIKITSIEPRGGCRLRLTFSDGSDTGTMTVFFLYDIDVVEDETVLLSMSTAVCARSRPLIDAPVRNVMAV